MENEKNKVKFSKILKNSKNPHNFSQKNFKWKIKKQSKIAFKIFQNFKWKIKNKVKKITPKTK